MLQACLNGGRRRHEAPGVPLSPEELARDARAAMAAGAHCLHVHPRDDSGAESLLPGDVGAALAAIRAAVPGIAVGVSSGIWIAPGGRDRHGAMTNWKTLPDYASVNFCENDAPEVMALLAARGVGIEAGIWSVADARRFLTVADLPKPLRILVEMQDVDPAEALAEAERVLAILRQANRDEPVLLHGLGRSTWAMIGAAARLGLDTRIGFEDVLVLPDGTPAPDNAALVSAAAAMLTGGTDA